MTDRLEALIRTLDGADSVTVVTHDNPDPDAIASSAALTYLIQSMTELPVTTAFGGIIGRAENRALMDELDMPFRRIEGLELRHDSILALVDTQPRAGNNSLPEATSSA